MNIKTFIWFLCVSMLFLFTASRSATGINHSMTSRHDLTYYVEKALHDNLSYQVAAYDRKESLLRTHHLKSLWYPIVAGTVSYNQGLASLSDVSGKSHGVDVLVGAQEHLFSFSDPAKLSAADIGHNMVILRYAKKRQKLIRDVTKSYFDVLQAEELLNVAKINFRRATLADNMSKLAYKVNVRTISQLKESQAEKSRANILLDEATSKLHEVKSYLSFLSGSPVDQLKTLKKNILLKLPIPRDIHYWRQAAEGNNLDLRMEKYNVDLAHMEARIAQRDRYPTFTLAGGYFFSQSPTQINFIYGPFSTNRSLNPGSMHATTLQVSASMPIFSENLNYHIQKYANKISKSQLSYENLRHEIDLEVSNYYLRLLLYHNQIGSNLSVVRSIKSAYTQERNKVEQHQKSILDLLILQSKLSDAMQQYTTSRYVYLNDKIKLLSIAGHLSMKSIKTINRLLSS